MTWWKRNIEGRLADVEQKAETTITELEKTVVELRRDVDFWKREYDIHRQLASDHNVKIKELEGQLQAEKDASLRLEERHKRLQSLHKQTEQLLISWWNRFPLKQTALKEQDVSAKTSCNVDNRSNEESSLPDRPSGVPIDSYRSDSDLVDREQIASSGVPHFFQDDDQPDAGDQSSTEGI